MAEELSPEQIAQRIATDPGHYGLPAITSLEPITGGLVHHVWKLQTAEGVLILKVRGNTFANVRQIACDPSDVIHEAKATSIFQHALPAHFPQVVACHPDQGILVLTDVLKGNPTLEALFQEGEVCPAMCHTLGRTYLAIHDSTAGLSESIRENDDDDFYSLKLQHKLVTSGHPTLIDLAEELARTEPRQIIVGDPSPKNASFLADTGEFTFFDLEDAHRGNVVFDVGFLIGHLIVHSGFDPERALRFVEEFVAGYALPELDQRLTKAIALAAVIYRVSARVPYSHRLTENQQAWCLKATRSLLDARELARVPWSEITSRVLSE